MRSGSYCRRAGTRNFQPRKCSFRQALVQWQSRPEVSWQVWKSCSDWLVWCVTLGERSRQKENHVSIYSSTSQFLRVEKLKSVCFERNHLSRITHQTHRGLLTQELNFPGLIYRNSRHCIAGLFRTSIVARFRWNTSNLVPRSSRTLDTITV